MWYIVGSGEVKSFLIDYCEVEMEWKANEIIKLLGLIFGFLLSLVGAFLLLKEIQAVGSISIKTLIGAGEVTSGSAGLFLLFFSFFIIVLALSGMHANEKRKASRFENFSNSFKVLAILLISLGIGIFIVTKVDERAREVISPLLFLLGFIIFFWIIAMIACLAGDNESEDKDKNSIR